ncbi:hypothetical protein JX265_009463 [Neoarthrinium moseri]|uniref:Endoglucanase n=1 Tax=Neoarthrinium moseri TaxID=1658444 RepID=A0A9P9WFK6_9PEZI|nr:uncharacterized protein JN550_010705 [Neoarthrinium moseri]KAI1844876.1 hypothetical protein JX266_008892 [Neoarthrinium moseri]KAI1861496.1 hypothetical protein JX265_009463 [Neoarthrinium moseri]KAI1861765.1 hypothetical protein JN550_010705 [Neoarthrinium moseri]
MAISMRLLAAMIGLKIPIAHGHTFMQNPVPFPSQYLDNGPVAKDGSNWPCSGDTEYDRAGIANVWKRGSQQYLQAMGGATHGGGSCQISITLDPKPNRQSQWRVIHSIEGGCPIRNLTEVNYGESPTVLLPSIYNFTVPNWVPIGPVIMAWTWYGRWSVPEMFMNCAPIMVLGGPQEPDVPESVRLEKFHAAPLVFEANNGNGCWTMNQGNCVKFPNPGNSVEVNEECPLDELHQVTGTCGPEHVLAKQGWSGVHLMLYQAMAAIALVVGAYLGCLRVQRHRSLSHRSPA